MACHDCKISPITGIRYQCSICKHFDLCEKCLLAKQHNEDHPFIKIRDPKAKPLDVKGELKDNPQPEKLEEKAKESEVKDELKYETKQEKVLVITSFLENIFGPDNFQSYK